MAPSGREEEGAKVAIEPTMKWGAMNTHSIVQHRLIDISINVPDVLWNDDKTFSLNYKIDNKTDDETFFLLMRKAGVECERRRCVFLSAICVRISHFFRSSSSIRSLRRWILIEPKMIFINLIHNVLNCSTGCCCGCCPDDSIVFAVAKEISHFPSISHLRIHRHKVISSKKHRTERSRWIYAFASTAGKERRTSEASARGKNEWNELSGIGNN